MMKQTRRMLAAAMLFTAVLGTPEAAEAAEPAAADGGATDAEAASDGGADADAGAAGSLDSDPMCCGFHVAPHVHGSALGVVSILAIGVALSRRRSRRPR